MNAGSRVPFHAVIESFDGRAADWAASQGCQVMAGLALSTCRTVWKPLQCLRTDKVDQWLHKVHAD